MSENRMEIEAIISGKVRGVNYHNFVKKKADGLWIFGEVENLPDFKVRVIAQGNEARLEKLIEHLWKGPFGSKVSNVEVSWRELVTKFDGFKIKF